MDDKFIERMSANANGFGLGSGIITRTDTVCLDIVFGQFGCRYTQFPDGQKAQYTAGLSPPVKDGPTFRR